MFNNQKPVIPLHDLGNRYVENRQVLLPFLEKYNPTVQVVQLKDLVDRDKNYYELFSNNGFPCCILNQEVESFKKVIEDLSLMNLENLQIPRVVVIGTGVDYLMEEYDLNADLLYTLTGHLSNCNPSNIEKVLGDIAESCFKP